MPNKKHLLAFILSLLLFLSACSAKTASSNPDASQPAKPVSDNRDPLLASDTELSAEDIVPWNALHEYGGLYLLSPTFGIEALSCSQQTQQLYTDWTIAEYLALEKSLQPIRI